MRKIEEFKEVSADESIVSMQLEYVCILYYNDVRVQLIAEGGQYLHLMERFPYEFCQMIGHVPPSVTRKASSTIELGSGELIDIGWEYFRNVLWTLLGSIAGSTSALLAEIVRFKVGQMVKRSKARKRLHRTYEFNRYSA